MAKRMPIKLFVHELEAAYRRGDGYIMASYGQNPRTGRWTSPATCVIDGSITQREQDEPRNARQRGDDHRRTA